jgi:excisionase family DNA binding protein
VVYYGRKMGFDTAEYLTPKQVAELYGVHINTVDAWIKDKKIKVKQPFGPQGRRFIRRIDVGLERKTAG